VHLHDLLTAKPTSFLGWSGLRDPMLVALMARAGYDAVLLDQQHGFHDSASSVSGITELALAGKPSLVRIKVGDFAEGARMVDYGASGIVAPMINSAGDARSFASFVKYPPIGQRSWGPGRAMQLSGSPDGLTYFNVANASTVAIAMCETREALADLDGILSVEGVDGILAGPGDLSIALLGRLDPGSCQVLDAMGEIARKTRAAGKIASAFAGSVDKAREMIACGFQLVTVSYDEDLIESAFKSAVAAATA
jgi:4-hydroxy-2-oxoheptanedioate aldolase